MLTKSIFPVTRRKLYQEVADQLLVRIRTGEFAADERLPSERSLMHTYQVGRSAVREALFSLERMGLIEIVHGERARLAHPTPQSIIRQVTAAGQHLLADCAKNLDYLKDARMFFETSLTRLAAERASDADIRRLQANLRTQEQSLHAPQAFAQTDQHFHGVLAEISGNPILAAISQTMFDWLTQTHTSLVQTPGSEHLSLAEHQRIFKAIAAHDPDGAVRAMQDHLSRANRRYVQALRKQDALT